MIDAIVQGIGDHLEQRGFHIVRHSHHRAVTARRPKDLGLPFFDIGIFIGVVTDKVIIKKFDTRHNSTSSPQTTLISETRVDLADPNMLEQIEEILT